MDIAKRSTDTCMATAANILLYHMEDLAVCSPDERLKVFYGLFNRIIENELENPSERQQFAEWYWSSCTGNYLIRSKRLEEFNMAKKYSAELSSALKNCINYKGLDMHDICPACGISKGVYYNLVGGGNYSKKAFDAVAKYVGLKIDGALTEMYNQRFDIGDNRRTERMEELALKVEREYDAVKVTKAEPENVEQTEPAAPVDELVDKPEVKAAPVDALSGALNVAPVEKAVDIDTEYRPFFHIINVNAEKAVANDSEEVPYLDCNDMYKEVKATDKPVLMSMDYLIANLEAYADKLQELEDERALLIKEAEKLGRFINLMKAYKNL